MSCVLELLWLVMIIGPIVMMGMAALVSWSHKQDGVANLRSVFPGNSTVTFSSGVWVWDVGDNSNTYMTHIYIILICI